jgi:hypothetical protein
LTRVQDPGLHRLNGKARVCVRLADVGARRFRLAAFLEGIGAARAGGGRRCDGC